MDIIGILSTVILLVTIGTITVAVAAYAAELRDGRKPKPKAVGVPGHDATDDFQPVFF